MTCVRVKINDLLVSVGQPQSKRDGGEGLGQGSKGQEKE